MTKLNVASAESPTTAAGALLVVPDPGDRRIGSGAATLHAMAELGHRWLPKWFRNWRVLLAALRRRFAPAAAILALRQAVYSTAGQDTVGRRVHRFR